VWVSVVAFISRFRRRLSTPDLYRLIVAGLTVLGLGAGIAGLVTVRHRSAMIGDMRQASGPLTVVAQELYRSLSDADATAAGAFLLTESDSQRQRYLDDIARASAAVTVATRAAGDADAVRLRDLAAQLSVYTGLIETARSYDRVGLPLGGAYLREASSLMRTSLLPAAEELLAGAQGRLTGAQREATGFPWAVTLLGLLALVALLTAQVLVFRRSNRMINPGLAAASLLLVVSVVWSIAALGASAGQVEIGRRDGSASAAVLTDARRAALQSRADEALTLIARGGGDAYEADLKKLLDGLIGADGRSGLLADAARLAPAEADRTAVAEARDHAVRWRELHGKVRENDSGGDWETAVMLATTPNPDNATEAFGKLDEALTGALRLADARVDRQAERAGRALTGLTFGLILLAAGQVAAVLLGFRPRLREYR
jgi:hypothetical protein